MFCQLCLLQSRYYIVCGEQRRNKCIYLKKPSVLISTSLCHNLSAKLNQIPCQLLLIQIGSLIPIKRKSYYNIVKKRGRNLHNVIKVDVSSCRKCIANETFLMKQKLSHTCTKRECDFTLLLIGSAFPCPFPWQYLFTTNHHFMILWFYAICCR